jgi:hypothetical protein
MALKKKFLTIFPLAVLHTLAQARGVTPYLPLNLDPEVEREVERVLILGDKPVLTRPIPAAVVLDALPKACTIDAVLCGRVRRYLKRYMHPSGIEFASAGAQWRNILPGWDLGLDYTYGIKVARLRLLPNDVQSGQRPDSFYDIDRLDLYLSRKF